MSEELKPCPFCGEVPPSPKHNMMYDYWYTACTTEWHPVIEFRARIRVDVIAAWNRRYDPALAAEKSAREKAEARVKELEVKVAGICAAGSTRIRRPFCSANAVAAGTRTNAFLSVG